MGIYTFEKRDQPVSVSSAPNESFGDFTARIVEVAREKIALVVGYFYNERTGFVELRCGPETEWEDLVEAHYAKFDDGGLRPEASLKAQTKLNNLVINLQFLDFSNMEDVLAWLHRFAAATSFLGINYDPEGVLDVFKSHGYEPEMRFLGNSQENKGKKIVTSCLKELKDKGKIDVRMTYTYIGNWQRWNCSN